MKKRFKFQRTKNFETEVYGSEGSSKANSVRKDVVAAWGDEPEAAKASLKKRYTYDLTEAVKSPTAFKRAISSVTARTKPPVSPQEKMRKLRQRQVKNNVRITAAREKMAAAATPEKRTHAQMAMRSAQLERQRIQNKMRDVSVSKSQHALNRVKKITQSVKKQQG